MPPAKYHLGKFPPGTLDWPRLIPLIGPAYTAIARYDGVLSAVPNADVLLSPLTTQEAVLSSKIEGTVTTVEEVLEFEAGGRLSEQAENSPKRNDIYEVINYRRAITKAVERLKDLPISGRLIKEAHAVLLDGVRGQNRAPGEFRRDQNWIGAPDSTIETAKFVPIAANLIGEGMSKWEKFIHSQQHDLLVQLAIIHAEFESLHPFMDGNGRMGRMLIPLFLFERKVLSRPTLYVSAYLEARREEYYERLLAVSRDGDWTGWCAFFLEALRVQGTINSEKARALIDLYNDKKTWISEQTKSPYAIHALEYVFKRPIFNGSDFVANAGIPKPTAKRIVRVLRDEGMLKVLHPSSGRSPALYAFADLLNVTEGRKVF
jgi:Fic family protein